MERKDTLSKIIFLIRELEYTRERIKSAGPHALDIEIALLNQQVVNLFNQIQQYNRLGWEKNDRNNEGKEPIKIPIQSAGKSEENLINVTPAMPKPEVKNIIKVVEKQLDMDESVTPSKKISEPEEKDSILDVSQPEPTANEKNNLLSKAETLQNFEIRDKEKEPSKDDIASVYAKARERILHNNDQSKVVNKVSSPSPKPPVIESQEPPKIGLRDKIKLTPIQDLRTAISINQRITFTNQLFHGDDKEFRRVISNLNNLSNFAEAKMFLQSEIAKTHHWDLESPIVEEFMELAYRKFL
jgi:hypothetical protein